jgi:hypothetical protein
MLIMKTKTKPFGLNYEIVVDRKFENQSLVVEKTELGGMSRKEIVQRRGAWFIDGKERRDLRDCIDIDMEASPATNTIPIGRIALRVGEKVDLDVVWVRFPTLKVMSMQQSYKRLGSRTYLYQSSTGFSARIKVDAFGLVTRYGNIWNQVG